MTSSFLADSATRAVQRRTMIVLIVAQIVGTIGVGVAPAIGVLLAEDVTHSEAWAGLARTASTLGTALFGLVLGNLAARRGRRVALTSGWWLAAAGSVLLVAAAQWNLVIPLFIGLLFIGTGSAVSLQSRFAATDLAEPEHKTRALARVVWVGTIGSVLGPNLGRPGEFMGSATGLTAFASAFLIGAICLCLAGLTVFVWLRPDPLLLSTTAHVQTSTQTGMKPPRMQQVFTEIRENTQARVALAAILTGQIVMVAIMTMTPVHVEHVGGSITTIGITISLHVAGMFALAPVVGAVADRFGHRNAISIGIAIFLSSLVIGAVKPNDTGWIMVSLFLLGLGWAFVSVVGSALFSAVISPATRASSQGGVDALASLCGAIAAFIAGPILLITSFSFLSLIAITALIPLTILVGTRPISTQPNPATG